MSIFYSIIISNIEYCYLCRKLTFQDIFAAINFLIAGHMYLKFILHMPYTWNNFHSPLINITTDMHVNIGIELY